MPCLPLLLSTSLIVRHHKSHLRPHNSFWLFRLFISLLPTLQDLLDDLQHFRAIDQITIPSLSPRQQFPLTSSWVQRLVVLIVAPIWLVLLRHDHMNLRDFRHVQENRVMYAVEEFKHLIGCPSLEVGVVLRISNPVSILVLGASMVLTSSVAPLVFRAVLKVEWSQR
jgi:hypothetical protein